MEKNSVSVNPDFMQKTGIVIVTNDPETCWVALRYAGFCLMEKKEVRVFLEDLGVNYLDLSTSRFNIRAMAQKFIEAGGTIEVYAGRTMLEMSLQKYFSSLLKERDILSICREGKFRSLMTKEVYILEFNRIV